MPEEQQGKFRLVIHPNLFYNEAVSSLKKIARHLIDKGYTLATAESCTGGLLAHRLTNVSGSSTYFMGGLVAYHNDVKTLWLNIPAKLLQQHGAVSAPVAEQMARHVRRMFQTDYGIGITGIAGPGGGTRQKPVGLVYIAVTSKQGTTTRKSFFQGTRLQIKKQSVDAALKLLSSRFG